MTKTNKTKKFRIKECVLSNGDKCYVPQRHMGRVPSLQGTIFPEYAKNEEDDNWSTIYDISDNTFSIYEATTGTGQKTIEGARKSIANFKKSLKTTPIITGAKVVEYLN